MSRRARAWLAALAPLAALVALPGPTRADEPPPVGLTPGLIDERVDSALAGAGLEPSPLADDATFLRRLWLDLTGGLPPAEEVERFLAERAPGKRAAAIEALVATPEAARRAAELWTSELFDGPARDGGAALLRGAFRDWLANELQRDRPWDELAAELLAGEGRTDQAPALLWTLERAATADPSDLAGPALRQMLGLRLECARCHDHPFQRWTQAEFHAVSACFARTRVRPEPGMQAVFRVSEAPVGEHRMELAGPREQGAERAGKREVAPAFPSATAGAAPAELPPGVSPTGVTRTSRRAAFARWVTSPGNPWFARAAVNRVWARLFGRGLVEPVDDLEAAAPDAPLAPLLEQLAGAFARDGFSLRRLTVAILSSRAWQRSSRRADGRFEAARARCGTARVRPLDGAALAGALLAAAGRDRPGPGETARIHQALRERLRGELAAALPLPAAPGDPEQVTTAQALAVLVGPAVTGLVRGPLVERTLAAAPGTDARLRHLWLGTLGRPPSAGEKERARVHLRQQGDARAAWEDLAWALVAGSEFHTNH